MQDKGSEFVAIQRPGTSIFSVGLRQLRSHWPFAIVAVIGAVLIFTNLGSDYLWEDEGDTAALASNILKFGVPKAWDGAAFLDFSILPADLRREFGYTEAGYAGAQTAQKQQQEVAVEYQRRIAAETATRQAEEQRQRAEAQAASALLAAQRAQLALAQQQSSIATRDYTATDYTTRDYGTTRYTGSGYTGGTVHVSGYTRKDGTYVHSYTRRK